MRVHPKLSASCLALALLLGSMWWSAMSTYVVLHDDARIVGTLARTLDQPAVRQQLARWAGDALDQAAKLAGDSAQSKAARRAAGQLQEAIGSTAPIEPLVQAVTVVAVATRDAAVSQLDARAAPKTVVRADVAPLFTLAGVEIDKKTAKALGLTLTTDKKTKVTRLTLPLLTGDQLDLLQRRYDWMILVRSWAGWAALALLAASVATSRYPLRTLAIAAGLVAVIAFVLPRLLVYAQLRTTGSTVEGLVAPLLTAASVRLAAVAVPVTVVAGLLTAGLGGLQLVLRRRHDRQGRLRDHPESVPDS